MKLTPSEIQEIFKRDIHNICGFNLFMLNECFEMLGYQSGFTLTIDDPYNRECREIVGTNVSKVCDKYLTYRPEHIEDPVEHYRWIVQNRYDIEKMLCEGLQAEKPEDISEDDYMTFLHEGGGFLVDPIRVRNRQNILEVFSKLFEHLVGVGERHKFDPQLAYEYLYRQDETEEN